MKLKIGIFGETSGKIRDALRRRGFDAVSVDFNKSKAPGPHIRGNFLDVIAHIFSYLPKEWKQ